MWAKMFLLPAHCFPFILFVTRASLIKGSDKFKKGHPFPVLSLVTLYVVLEGGDMKSLFNVFSFL